MVARPREVQGEGIIGRDTVGRALNRVAQCDGYILRIVVTQRSQAVTNLQHSLLLPVSETNAVGESEQRVTFNVECHGQGTVRIGTLHCNVK